MKSVKSLKGGLQEVADDLQVSFSSYTLGIVDRSTQVQRVGTQHQAGSDSLLTASTFFKMRSKFFEDEIDDSKYMYASCTLPAVRGL